jgi:hypothetical protein
VKTRASTSLCRMLERFCSWYGRVQDNPKNFCRRYPTPRPILESHPGGGAAGAVGGLAHQPGRCRRRRPPLREGPALGGRGWWCRGSFVIWIALALGEDERT